MTVFSPCLIDLDSMAFATSSSLSNTRALPVNSSPSLPVIFETHPPGARFPRRMLGVSEKETDKVSRGDDSQEQAQGEPALPKMAGSLDRLAQRTDYILSVREVLCVLEVLGESLARHRHD
jgi:hypothetical protein